MSFNFSFLFKMIRRAFTAKSDTNARLTPKRVFVLVFLFTIYFFIELFNWLGLLLDELIYPDYRKIEVDKPVFIVGVPRSGTTFLQRLMAKDVEQFTSMQLWEVLFAPSIIQKKFWLAIGRLDRMIGSPGHKLIVTIENRRFKNLAKMHKVSLFEKEEDDPILIHIFSSAFLSFSLPFLDDFRPIIHFDTELPRKDRERIMEFYKRCVQRHLYVFGKHKKFLSKNPASSPKIKSLIETFPDARIINIARNPLQTIPSSLSLLTYFFGVFCSLCDEEEIKKMAMEMVSHWYQYPLAALKEFPDENYAIVKYDDLVSGPKELTDNLYSKLDLNMSTTYEEVLEQQQQKARKYKSKHSYSLGQYGLSESMIRREFKEVFDRFEF